MIPFYLPRYIQKLSVQCVINIIIITEKVYILSLQLFSKSSVYFRLTAHPIGPVTVQVLTSLL